MSSVTPSLNGLAPNASTTHSAGTPAFITSTGRDLRIDLLRGLCVLIVIVNHVAGASPLYLLTGGGQFLTSAAEGFILISGLTAGLVYRRLVVRDGLVPAMTKALRRAFSLYLLTVGLTLLLVPLSELFQLPWANSLDLSRSARFVISVLTLHRTYAFVDILLLYALLFLALPLALLLIERGQALLVLLISWLIWLVYQVYPEPATFPWPVSGGNLFPFVPWQVLFFTTFIVSYYRDRLPSLKPSALNRLHLLTALGFAALILLFVLLRLPADRMPAQLAGLQGWTLDNVFDRANLRPGRIVASAMVFGFLLLSVTRWWTPISRTLQGLLLPFGEQALYAWTAHIVVVLAIGLILKSIAPREEGPWLNAALQIIAAAAVWFFTRHQFLALNASNRVYWYATPAVLALLALLVLQLPYFDRIPPPPPRPATTQITAVDAALK